MKTEKQLPFATFLYATLTCLTAILIVACDSDDFDDLFPDPTPEPTASVSPEPTTQPTNTTTPEPTQSPSLFIPDNCNNPGKQYSSTSGFKCKGSDTRGGTIVCLLAWESTFKPYVTNSEGHLESTRKFSAVHIVLKNGNFIDLNWSGYANPVYLPQGKVSRQHWRHPSLKWDNVKNRADYIEMQRGNRRTCLKF